jgi:leucyl aminopeptidase
MICFHPCFILYPKYANGGKKHPLYSRQDFEPYKKMIRASVVADLNNSPGRKGGAITAGLFLGEFAGNTPWVHLDIAGTVWKDNDEPLYPQGGGTGVMVRTLTVLADHFSDDPTE